MGEAYPTGVFGLFTGKADGVLIFVTGGEQVQFISNGPGVHFQLKEQLVYRQIERIHHPVFPFIHDPQRLVFADQQLGAAIIAADSMGQHKLLIVRQGRRSDQIVISQANLNLAVEMLQCV
ncbi:hypothetical protein D3C87_1816050 [compost metagenome]